MGNSLQNSDYDSFISSKVVTAQKSGFEINSGDLHKSLYPHQRDIVSWSLQGGNRAIFASFGL